MEGSETGGDGAGDGRWRCMGGGERDGRRVGGTGGAWGRGWEGSGAYTMVFGLGVQKVRNARDRRSSRG